MVLFTVKTPHPIRILAHRAHHMRSIATWAVQVVGSPSRTVCKPSTDLNGEICSVLHGGQLVHLQATAHITTLTQNSQISHRRQTLCRQLHTLPHSPKIHRFHIDRKHCAIIFFSTIPIGQSHKGLVYIISPFSFFPSRKNNRRPPAGFWCIRAYEIFDSRLCGEENVGLVQSSPSSVWGIVHRQHGGAR